ncbi:glycosyltransferase [Pseudomonas subflava]|uniref:glycosyltransferase n=1 Tax=Pseudomonas subflava TaxID=2952933 RepID=UPI00331595E7
MYRTYYPDPPGGLQEAIRQICLATQPLGVESRVFTLSPSPTPSIILREEGRVTRAKSWIAPASCDLGGFSAFRAFSQEAEWADVLHFHFPWPFADVLNLLPAARKPKILTYHSDIVRQKFLSSLYSPLMRITMRSMDAVVATSPAYAQTSIPIQRYVPADKLRIIPLGIADIAHIRPEDTSHIIDRLGLSNSPYVLALGVLRYYKGLHTLISAAKKIRGKIVIAGGGPESEKLRAQMIALNAENVIFAGRVDEKEKHELLRQCSSLVLPSHLRSEAFGMVLLEAAMYGRPLVCCDIGSGMSYVNQDGITGFLVPPESPEELASAINQLLDKPIQARKMGQNARERFLSLFSEEPLGKNYQALYSDLARHRLPREEGDVN